MEVVLFASLYPFDESSPCFSNVHSTLNFAGHYCVQTTFNSFDVYVIFCFELFSNCYPKFISVFFVGFRDTFCIEGRIWIVEAKNYVSCWVI